MNTRDTRKLTLLSALSLAGLGVSASLTQHYYEVRNGTAGFKSFCNIADTMNCDVIAASSYAELFAGIPLSSFAAGWFVALFILSLMARIEESRRETLRAALAISGIGCVFSLVYLVIMAGVLKTYCLLCLVLDGINFAALATVISLKPESLKTHPVDTARWRSISTAVVASLLITVVALKGMDKLSIKSSLVDEAVQEVMNTPVLPIQTGEEFPSFGSKNAPITIVEFADFQCGHCRQGALILHSILNRYTGKVRLVFKNFPMDPACNREVQHAGHPVACEAARAAHCGHQQGKFEPVYEELFEHQETLSPGKPLELAKAKGLDEAKLQACMNSADTAGSVVRDLEEGKRLGVRATPTFFVNGRKIEGAYPVPVWIKIIDQLLAQQPAGTGT